MKITAIGRLLLALLCFLSAASAAPRAWQDAVVVHISTGDTGTSVVVPIGPNLVSGRIFQTNYFIETADLEIVVATRGKKPLNITVNRKTRIAIDGMKAYLIDDAGKEIKLPILRKIAKAATH